MCIEIQYQKIDKGIQHWKFLYVRRNSVPEKIDIGIQYQKKIAWGGTYYIILLS